MGRRIAIGFGCLAVLAAVAYFTTMRFGETQRTIDAVLAKYAFTPLNPQSTLVPPGTLVTVLKDRPLVVGVICPDTDSLGATLHSKLLSSDSSSSQEAAELTGEFSLDANAKDALSGGVHSKFLTNVTGIVVECQTRRASGQRCL
ncbi:MAG TPA: hypothetical protein VG055_29890 [Planctomycetaceae bacterium]|nr:hypothetical protein [Planctomycetaceae bacterium]